MILSLHVERLRTPEQVRAFLDGSEPVDFNPVSRDEAYAFVSRTLTRFDYARLGKPDRGLVKRFLGNATGLSRAQLTRLVRQFAKTGQVVDRRGGAPRRPFERRYTAADIRLLAEVDATLGQMAGPATREVMRREFEVYGDGRFARLAHISIGHLYNLRKSTTYLRKRTVLDRTRPTRVAIGARRPARLRSRRHRPPGRPRRQQGRLPDQRRRRGHPVRVRRRRRGHLRALPGPGPRRPARPVPLRHPRLPRRQRQRVHQPPGRRAARQAARRVHQVPPPAFQRQVLGFILQPARVVVTIGLGSRRPAWISRRCLIFRHFHTVICTCKRIACPA